MEDDGKAAFDIYALSYLFGGKVEITDCNALTQLSFLTPSVADFIK